MTSAVEFYDTPEGMTAVVHAPGGRIQPADWAIVAQAARDYADGHLYLSTEAEIEFHGVTDTDALAEAMAHSSFIAGCYRVMAAPLSPTARRTAAQLATSLAEVAIAPHTRRAIAVVEEEPGASVAELTVVCRGGQEPTFQVRSAEGVTEVSEAQLAATVARALESQPPQRPAAMIDRSIGWLAEHRDDHRVDLGAGLVDGVLSAAYAELLGHLGLDISLTPWRGIVIHDIADGDAEVVVRVLAPRGFIFDAASPHLDKNPHPA